jgi:hypothetical protein
MALNAVKSSGRWLGCKSQIPSDFGGFADLITFKTVMIILIIKTQNKLF